MIAKIRRGRAIALVVSLLVVALLGWRFHARHVDGARESALRAARRANVIELIPADIDRDGMLDLIAGYEPTMEDKPGERFSVVEALDGRTGRVRWTLDLPVRLSRVHKAERSAVVTERYVALTGYRYTGNYESELSVWMLELATGHVVWEKTFPRAEHWVGGGFRVWPVADVLLVMTNTRGDRDVDAEYELVAFEIATGAQRWRVPLDSPLGSSAPIVTEERMLLKLETRRVDEAGHEQWTSELMSIEPATGAVQRLRSPDERDLQLLADAGTIWIPCAHDRDECGGTSRPSVPGVTWVKAPPGLGAVARYKDRILRMQGVPRESIAAWRVDTPASEWVFDPGRPLVRVDQTMGEYAPDATYLRVIPARYLPVLLLDESLHLVVLDLETGQAAWESKPFVGMRVLLTPFTVRGTRYYFNLETPHGEVLVSFNGATGKFDGIYQIEVEGELVAPNLQPGYEQMPPYPWHFQSGVLVGGRGRHTWILDLLQNRLQMSTGATLHAPWDVVEAKLGPLPRPIM